jgi:beta-galactosidase
VAGIERDSLLGLHRALFPTHVQIDYVHADHVTAEQLAAVQARVPGVSADDAGAAGRCSARTWRAGGALVAEARAGWNDERGYAAPIIPGLGLHEVLGARETAVQTGAGGRTTLRWTGPSIPGVAGGDLLPGPVVRGDARAGRPAGAVVAQFEDGRPAAVLSTFGKGQDADARLVPQRRVPVPARGAAERFYAGLLDWAGVARPVRVDPAELEVHARTRPERVVIVLNHGQTTADARVSLATGAARALDGSTSSRASR